MNPKFTPTWLVVFVLLEFTPVWLSGQTTVTWTGLGNGDGTHIAENWLGNTLPINDGSEEYIFGPAARYFASFYNDVNARKVSIIGNTVPYELDDDSGVLNIGEGGLVYAPAAPVHSFTAAYPVMVAVNQTWDIQSGAFEVEYDIAGAGQITKSGAGLLILRETYSDSWTGGLNLAAGSLGIGPGYSSGLRVLGYGPLTFSGGTLVVSGHFSYSNYANNSLDLANPVVSNGTIKIETSSELTFLGGVTLNADTTVQVRGMPLFVDSAITESGGSRQLTVDSDGLVVLTGANSYTGGTHVAKGGLIFGNLASLPATPGPNALSSTTLGYIGFGDTISTDLQTDFINRFNKAATFGSLGFDSDPNSSIHTFTGNIDLTGFAASARLGSATNAILTGTLTPQGIEYRFGGGGGRLEVTSRLTDQVTPVSAARSLVLNSPAAFPLTLRLTYNGNDYTGGTSVTNSGLIFGYSGMDTTFPSGARDISINNGGYVGFEYWGDQSDSNLVINSLQKIHTASVGMVGFDGIYSTSAPIDLSAFTNALYLGTATLFGEGAGLTLSGTITPAGGPSAPYRFAGYKGGALEIVSTLTGANGVYIGDPNSPGSFGDYLNQEYSIVALSGNNSALTGNVTLYGGQLMVGQTNGTVGADPTTALGTGTLVVAGMTLPAEWRDEDGEAPAPQLGTVTDGLILPNNIVLNHDLNIAEENHLVLTGQISGSGEIYLEGSAYSYYPTWLTLNNDANNFSGGIYLASYSKIDVNADHATGTGPLAFGYSSQAVVNFNTSAPVIGGLSSREYVDYATLYAGLTNTVLTINQASDSAFSGEFRSNAIYPDDNFRVVKNGAGTLLLEDGGLYYYHGTAEAALPGSPLVSLQVNQGTLVLGSSFYTGETASSTVWVHGGNLALEDGHYLYNPVVVDNGGRLSGSGNFSGSVSLGAGTTLSPGLTGSSKVGTMHFSHLELNGGGAYEWQIMKTSALAQSFSDLITVYTEGTLVLNATAESPFSIKIISLGTGGDAGQLSGFDPSQSHSWVLFAFDVMSGGFDPAKFAIDTSGFANSLAFNEQGDGAFSVSLLSLSTYDNYLMLNFTPVPEPSTYGLMALGLGLIGWVAWRRRA
jgi:autotransporter-associated beta strand protein